MPRCHQTSPCQESTVVPVIDATNETILMDRDPLGASPRAAFQEHHAAVVARPCTIACNVRSHPAPSSAPPNHGTTATHASSSQSNPHQTPSQRSTNLPRRDSRTQHTVKNKLRITRQSTSNAYPGTYGFR
jgi:hypothetical protein